MNPDIKAKWIAALRSGEYHQTEGALRNTDAFCCLGVLCDLSNPANWAPSLMDDDCFDYGSVLADSLPFDLTDSYQIEQKIVKQLADMNDDGKSFTEIADFIEANL